MTGCYIGIDGCRFGWFAVAVAESGFCRTGLYPDLTAFSAAFPAADLILIDIPLGLPSCGPRRCDLEARKRLGRRFASSIFPPPCREALSASDYRTACESNQSVLGVRLSRQTFNILPKIREADQWRRRAEVRTLLVRESHPELVFWSLAGGKPLDYGKKTPEGKAERLELLARYYPAAEALFKQVRREYRKRDLADDDILDALCLAVTGWSGRYCLESIPVPPETDAAGLPMEIAFPAVERKP